MDWRADDLSFSNEPHRLYVEPEIVPAPRLQEDWSMIFGRRGFTCTSVSTQRPNWKGDYSIRRVTCTKRKFKWSHQVARIGLVWKKRWKRLFIGLNQIKFTGMGMPSWYVHCQCFTENLVIRTFSNNLLCRIDVDHNRSLLSVLSQCCPMGQFTIFAAYYLIPGGEIPWSTYRQSGRIYPFGY